MISSQWGWNYGKTAVIYSTSPAGWLRSTSENTYNAAGRISGLLDRGNVTNDRLTEIRNALGYGYAGTRIIYNESPAAWLQATAGRLSGLLDRGNVTNERLAAIELHTSDTKGRISGLLDRGNVTNERLLSTYELLDVISKGSEGGRVSLYNMGNAVEVIKNETRDLDNLLESVHDRLSALDALGVRLANIALIADEIKKGVNSSLQWYDTLHGDLSMLRHGAADLLPGYADWTVWDFLQGIYFDVGQIVDLLKGLQQTLTAWGNRWDSQDQYLMEWAKRWDALDKGASWSESDKGALFAKLDGISDRLSIEAGKTILDTIFGDMSLDATEAASAAVGSAIQNAFPFCVPAVLKQILGLLQADPAPPEFHFDFWGSPLDFGFSDWQGLADMTSWLSRIGFAVMLFANSRRFVYSGGVAGD